MVTRKRAPKAVPKAPAKIGRPPKEDRGEVVSDRTTVALKPGERAAFDAGRAKDGARSVSSWLRGLAWARIRGKAPAFDE